jgi:hypothetical protein
MNEDLSRKVRQALETAGETECRIVRSKSTGRVHYAAGYDGFRMCWTVETPSLKPQDQGFVEYVGVGVHGSRMRDLRRYAKILSDQGFPVLICGTHLHPSVKRVWIDLPRNRIQEEES